MGALYNIQTHNAGAGTTTLSNVMRVLMNQSHCLCLKPIHLESENGLDLFGLRLLFFIFFRHMAEMPTPKHMRQLTTWQVYVTAQRIFHIRASNRQPLPWDLGISAPIQYFRVILGHIRLIDNHHFQANHGFVVVSM